MTQRQNSDNRKSMRRIAAALAMIATIGTISSQAIAQSGHERVKVIALFHDKAPLPANLTKIKAPPRAVRAAMIKNARASQMDALRELNRRSGLVGRVDQLWLINGMVIETRADAVDQLQSLPGVKSISIAGQVHLIEPVAKSQVVSGRFAADPFTYGLSLLRIPELRNADPLIIGTGVNVGILDTGIEDTHADLRGRMKTWHDFVSKREKPYDDHGHGTHVAGTIAGGNASGTAIGVAPGAQLTVAKVFSRSGSASDSTLLAAMQWIADPDGNPDTNDAPSIVSNSWGGGSPRATQDPAQDAFCKAIDGWLKLGILPVFAAGNSGPRPGTVEIPGACPGAFAIGATDKADEIARFSSRGPTRWSTGELLKPDVSAPGVNVVSAAPGGGYQSMSGTSMATPHAAGVSALIVQMNPDFRPNDIAKVLAASTRDIGSSGRDTDTGWGRIDALRALKKGTQLRQR